MLQHGRTLLKIFFFQGVQSIPRFLDAFFLPKINADLLSVFFESAFKTLTTEEKKYLSSTQFHLRKKHDQLAVSILSKINEKFDLNISLDHQYVLTQNVERILKNRELRIFIEVLLLGKVSYEVIQKSIEEKFRLNKCLTIRDLEEYKHLCFDLNLMDDIDWQNYLSRLKQRCEEKPSDGVYENEFRDKVFALRNLPTDVLLRVGIKSQFNYMNMLSFIATSTFEKIQNDFETESRWQDIDAKIKSFKSIGEAYHKYVSPVSDVEEDILKGIEIEVIGEKIEALPYLDSSSDDLVEVE